MDVEIKSTSEGITNLNTQYHSQSIPGFISGFLDCDPEGCKGLGMLFSADNNNKELVILTKDMRFYIMPNSPDCDQEEVFKKYPTQLKGNEEGFCFLAWYISE